MATQTIDSGMAGSPAAGSFASIDDAVRHFHSLFDSRRMTAEDAFWGICRDFLKLADAQRITAFPTIMLIVGGIMDATKERVARQAVDILSDYDFKKITLVKAKEVLLKLEASRKDWELPGEPAVDQHPAKDLSVMLGYFALLAKVLRRDMPEEDVYWRTDDAAPLNSINFADFLVHVIRPTIIDIARCTCAMLEGVPVDKKALHDKLNVLSRDFTVISGIARSTSMYKCRVTDKGTKDTPLKSPAEVFACLHFRILATEAGKKHLTSFRRVAERMQKALDRIAQDAFNIIIGRPITAQELVAIRAASFIADDVRQMMVLEAAGFGREEMVAIMGKPLPEPTPQSAPQSIDLEGIVLPQEAFSAALSALEEEAMAEELEQQIMQDISDDSCPTLEDLARTQLAYLYAGADKNYQGAAIRAIRYILRKPAVLELNYAEVNWICGVCAQAGQKRVSLAADDPTAKFPEARKAFEGYKSMRNMAQLQANLRALFGDGSAVASLG